MLSVSQTMELTKVLASRGIQNTSVWINEHLEQECLKVLLDGFLNSYLLIEDTGSGYQFWDSVIRAKYNREHGVLHLVDDLKFPSGGVDHLRMALLSILSNEKNYVNTYYVICNEVPDLDGPALKARDDIYKLCEKYPMLFHRLDGCLCFESIVLSYRKLLHWLITQKESKKENEKELNDIQEILYAYRDIIAQYLPDDQTYTEQWMASLLFKITKDTKLTIIKKHMSTCWQSLCCFNRRDPCDLETELSLVNKCEEVFNNSYVSYLLSGVIL